MRLGRSGSRGLLVGALLLSGLATGAGRGSVATSALSRQADWSQFHYSADHRGVNPLETILSRATVPGLHLIWSAATSGSIGLSSPAVVDGIVYVGSLGHELSAFDATTGTSIWTLDTVDPVESSPAVAGGLVFVLTDTGELLAASASTGSIVWSQQVGAGGLIAPPTVDHGVLYQAGDQTVNAYEASTGTLLWSDPIIGAVRSAVSVKNGRVFVATDEVYSMDAATGAHLWAHLIRYDNFSESSPAVADKLLYVGSQNSATLFALTGGRGTISWQTMLGGGNLDSTPTVAYGLVFVADSLLNQIWAVDAQTGALRWSAFGGGTHGSLAAANGVLYAGTVGGNLFAYDALTGDVLWSYSIGSAIESSPVIVNGMLFVGADDGHLYAFGL